MTRSFLRSRPTTRHVHAAVRNRRTHQWRAPATCGQLLQGYVDGVDFMINCPIDLYSSAQALVTELPGIRLQQHDRFEPVLQSLRTFERDFRPEQGVSLRIDSTIPGGKGLARSSAEACAALAAVSACLDIGLSDADMAELITGIEPMVCTNFHGIAQFDFLHGKLIDRLPPPMGMRILIVDSAGGDGEDPQHEAAWADRERARSIYVQHRFRLLAAVARIKEGLRTRNPTMIGQAATEGAELSQIIAPKRFFPELVTRIADWKLLGINCAQRGSVLGLIFDERATSGAHLREQLHERFGDALPVLGEHRIIGGGATEQ